VIRIERLQVRVPAEFEPRGRRIGQLVGTSMTLRSRGRHRHQDLVSVPTVRVKSRDSDVEIAQRIAQEVASELGSSLETRGGGRC
jgi:hypothetical protein